MKIILTGAQSTGKSTILRQFEGKLPLITEVVRNLAKTGVKVNESGNTQGQHTIFSEYVRLLNETPNYISDRGLTDVLSYTLYHFKNLKDIKPSDVKEIKYEYKELKKLAKRKDILWVYFPIEFPVVDDGFRSVNEEFRKEIDTIIHRTLLLSGVKFITIHGSVEERIEQINQAIEKFNKNNK